MGKYKLDYDYLINLNKFSRYDNIIKMRIIGVTKTCYQVLWVESGNKTYEMIDKFDEEYLLVEELHQPPNILDYMKRDKEREKNIL